MLATDEQLLALTDRFHAAAVGADSWAAALQDLADLTGSRSGQLIGIGADTAVPFNWITNYDPAHIAEFAEMGGGDPAINPRVLAGGAAPAFQALTEADFLTPEEFRNTPIYADLFARTDIPFICLANVIKEPDMLVGITVNRTRREGNADDDVRRIITAIAPHVRAAVRTQMLLEDQGAALIAGAMDALSIAAFVCDRHGRVLSRSALTESLLTGEGPLRCVNGVLTARRRDQANDLARAIGASALRIQPQLTSIALTIDVADAPLVVDVAALPPRAHGFTLEARVLVVARLAQRDEDTKVSLLRAAFALSPAEAQISVALLAGRSAPEIAAARGASLHTVRTQIKGLYAKLGVSSRTELASRLAIVN